MKGIILCAGKSTRLYPASIAVNKTLLPIYDKSMIYYPLASLMQANIKDILIITSQDDLSIMKKLLGDGSQFGIKISYEVQVIQKGTADAINIGKEFIGDDSVCLIFGDNIYFGENFECIVSKASKLKNGAIILGYPVKNPTAFGVPEFDKNGKVISIEEKPKNPKSDFAITGMYFLDNKCVEFAKNLKPSARGELEITDILTDYLKENNLSLLLLDEQTHWLDTGNCQSMLDASYQVKNYQEIHKTLVASPELIAFNKNYISKEQLRKIIQHLSKTNYGEFLLKTLND